MLVSLIRPFLVLKFRPSSILSKSYSVDFMRLYQTIREAKHANLYWMSWTMRDREHETQWNKCSTDRSELHLSQTLVKNQHSLITSTNMQTFTPVNLRTFCYTDPKPGFTFLTISRSCHIMSRYTNITKKSHTFWVLLIDFYMRILEWRRLTKTLVYCSFQVASNLFKTWDWFHSSKNWYSWFRETQSLDEESDKVWSEEESKQLLGFRFSNLPEDKKAAFKFNLWFLLLMMILLHGLKVASTWK